MRLLTLTTKVIKMNNSKDVKVTVIDRSSRLSLPLRDAPDKGRGFLSKESLQHKDCQHALWLNRGMGPKSRGIISANFSLVCIGVVCQGGSVTIKLSPGLNHQCTPKKKQGKN